MFYFLLSDEKDAKFDSDANPLWVYQCYVQPTYLLLTLFVYFGFTFFEMLEG